MNQHLSKALVAGVACAFTQLASAGTEPYFYPLTQSSAVATPNHVNELTSPWVAPAGVSQVELTSMAEIESSVGQSVIRVPGLGTSASMWDMVAWDALGTNIFIPHETSVGAGASRYNLSTDLTTVIMAGDTGGLNDDWTADWGAFDPSTYTPDNTLLLAEEWSGLGRVMEIVNPYADPSKIRYRQLPIPSVAHEGLRFSADGTTLYFVDESNSGSLYKIVFRDPSNYAKGGTPYVLKVDSYAGDATANWNSGSNASESRTGRATWVKLTNASTNPYQMGLHCNGGYCDVGPTRGGRVAADELGATPYGRLEDLEVGKLANGRAVVYFTATSENSVYSVEELGRNKATVRLFLSETATPKNVGFLPTTATLNSPDNLAQDKDGNIYVIEDAPNGSDVGGDIWFARDTNSDGVAESLDHFLSIQVDGAEHTGMIFNPVNASQFVVAVQHPDSTDMDGGHGDALWLFDIEGAAAP